MEHIINDTESGKRLREILRQVMGISYSAMKSAKWDGRITVDGVPTPVDTICRTGQTVAIRFRDNTPAYAIRPYDFQLSIPYHDSHLMVIDKPAPLACQTSANHPDDALENALFANMGCPSDFIFRPVNRLDKGTSGLMVVAANAHSQHLLQRMLHSEGFRRIYLAVVEGHLPDKAGIIRACIGKEDSASIRRIVTPEGKPSVTHYEVLQETGSRTLVKLELETGRTHQIRVHMAHMGCPVAGDFLYGTELPELPGRFALHSHEIRLVHPVTGEAHIFTSALPDALLRLLD